MSDATHRTSQQARRAPGPLRRLRRAVDLGVQVGTVALPVPVLAASGCYGAGAELLGTVDAGRLGAVVTKSMSADPWPGNPSPRMHATAGGMLNAIGLQNPGVAAWQDELPALHQAGVRVVASIWGRSLHDYAAAAAVVGAEAAGADGSCIVAVEVNLSCPNLEGANEMFAHNPVLAAEVVAAVRAAAPDLPRWAKLSPNISSNVGVASAVADAGADAVVLTNTLIGLDVDIEARTPRLANGTGGLSGPPLRPVALRHVWEVHKALPALPIVGVGGISTADHAVQFLLAGASAVEIGAAHLVDPHIGLRVIAGLERWCRRQGVARVADLTGGLRT